MNTKIKLALGAAIGAGLGYAYYYYIGCSSGTCAITSNPYISVMYGSAMGILINIPTKKKPAKEAEENND